MLDLQLGCCSVNESEAHVGRKNWEGCPVSLCGKIDSFPATQKTFCNVYGPQFDTAELDVVSVDFVGTLRDNRKNFHPLVKNKKLKKGEHCGQPLGDM
jgi:hypothetical protein